MNGLSPEALSIVAGLRANLAALDDHKSAQERSAVYSFLAAHLRSASPMSFALPDPALSDGPVSEVIVPLQDGARIDLTVDDGVLVMYVVEPSGKDAAVGLSAGRAEDLRRGLARIISNR